MELHKVAFNLLGRSLGLVVLNHVSNDRHIRAQAPAALVHEAQFQGTHVTVKSFPKHFAFEPDLSLAFGFVNLRPEPALNHVTATMKVLGNCGDGAADHRHLSTAELIVDAIYEGKSQLASDPISKLLPGCGNMGGFRLTGQGQDKHLVALFTTGQERDWPDMIDLNTGQLKGVWARSNTVLECSEPFIRVTLDLKDMS
jgi:hypothetical protein